MNIESILNKILSDAQEQASVQLADAQNKIGEMTCESEKKLEGQRQQLEKRFEEESRAAEDRMKRMAELEDKKARLAVKREVMQQVFDRAVQKLAAMPDEKKRAFFWDALLENAQGGEELRVGREACGWFDASFLSAINQKLNEKGLKPLSQGKAADGCGFELCLGGATVRCTFDSLVADRRLDLEGEVAGTLFDA